MEGNQVARASVNSLTTAISEIEEAAMLQETPDDAGHPYVLADPRNSRTQAADAACEYLYFHPRLRSLVQQLNQRGIFQRIDLKDHVSAPAQFLMFNLSLD